MQIGGTNAVGLQGILQLWGCCVQVLTRSLVSKQEYQLIVAGKQWWVLRPHQRGRSQIMVGFEGYWVGIQVARVLASWSCLRRKWWQYVRV